MRSTRHADPSVPWMLVLILGIALLAGCGGDASDETAEAVELTADQQAMVAKAAAMANAIDNAPDQTEAVLKQFDVTLEEYQAMSYEIAASPAMTQAFEEAKTGP